MMRIITGKARGVRLEAPTGVTTRPTAERTKEAVFSMIQFELEGRRVLDLFAGSGQMGLEALSRGAASAVLCDHAKSSIAIINKNIEKTKLDGAKAVCSDALEYLRSAKRTKTEKFDIVFLDPPYAEKLIPKALELLVSGRLIKRTSLIICESAANEDVFGGNEALAARFDVIRQMKHGVAYINLITPKSGDTDASDDE